MTGYTKRHTRANSKIIKILTIEKVGGLQWHARPALHIQQRGVISAYSPGDSTHCFRPSNYAALRHPSAWLLRNAKNNTKPRTMQRRHTKTLGLIQGCGRSIFTFREKKFSSFQPIRFFKSLLVFVSPMENLVWLGTDFIFSPALFAQI
jgi:hypothetical protein